VLKHEEYRNDGSFPEFWTTKDNSLDYRLSKLKDVLVFNMIVKRKYGTKWPFIKAKTGTKDQRNQHTRNVTTFVSNENKKKERPRAECVTIPSYL